MTSSFRNFTHKKEAVEIHELKSFGKIVMSITNVKN